MVCLDDQRDVLRPANLWADQRSTEQSRATEQEIGQEQLASWIGNPLDIDFMLASWLWLREHETEVVGQTVQSIHSPSFPFILRFNYCYAHHIP